MYKHYLLILAIALALVLLLSTSEKFQYAAPISYNPYPYGISTIKVTPFNKVVEMPYDMPASLSTDQCTYSCARNKTRPNIILGKGVFAPKTVTHGGSSTDCVMSCSTTDNLI
jgi:hypothetical protein